MKPRLLRRLCLLLGSGGGADDHRETPRLQRVLRAAIVREDLVAELRGQGQRGARRQRVLVLAQTELPRRLLIEHLRLLLVFLGRFAGRFGLGDDAAQLRDVRRLQRTAADLRRLQPVMLGKDVLVQRDEVVGIRRWHVHSNGSSWHTIT